MKETRVALLAQLQTNACVSAAACKWAAGAGADQLLSKAKQVRSGVRLPSSGWGAQPPLPPSATLHCTAADGCRKLHIGTSAGAAAGALSTPHSDCTNTRCCLPQGADREAARLMEAAEFVSGPISTERQQLEAALDHSRWGTGGAAESAVRVLGREVVCCTPRLRWCSGAWAEGRSHPAGARPAGSRRAAPRCCGG